MSFIQRLISEKCVLDYVYVYVVKFTKRSWAKWRQKLAFVFSYMNTQQQHTTCYWMDTVVNNV